MDCQWKYEITHFCKLSVVECANISPELRPPLMSMDCGGRKENQTGSSKCDIMHESSSLNLQVNLPKQSLDSSHNRSDTIDICKVK